MKDKSKENLLPIIGVIGGVGPYAGLDFVQKIFANTLAKKDQDHLNCMLASFPSAISDRTGFLLKDEGENPAFGMFESAKRLSMAGARIAVVACNTAHSQRIFTPFCTMVKESLPDFEIVNMLETCANYVKKSHSGSVTRLGLLATIGTHKTRVYHEYFREEDGFTLIEPSPEGMEKVHDAIYNEQFGIKSQSKPVTQKAIELINHEICALIGQGAQAVILGCTELPLAVQAENYKAPMIDPGLLAARRLIELTCPEKLVCTT